MFLLKHPQYLESLIGQKLEQTEAEVPIGRRKVDLYAVNLSRRLPIFIESQVNPSDKRHLMKVLEIIDATSEGTIVWLASDFQQCHLEEVIGYMKSQKHKYIDFFALRLTQEAIKRSSEVNKLYKLDVWNNLHRIGSSQYPPLETYYAYSQVPSAHTGRAIAKVSYDFERVEDVKQYMLEKFRIHIPYLTNVWKSKKHNSNDCQLSIGGGRGGVNFKVSARNKYGHASIYLHFEECQKKLYHTFESRITELQKDIHPLLKAEIRKIGVSFKPDSDLDTTIIKLSQLFDKMLKTMGPELYAGLR
ncbi:hypothetical protein JJQ72_16785 [Paenibacillus sp. F411]|uniref:hypothetical protein n=1 Tax=Paenibacillus sp. F411 TaxID=2820239 RepID=UPI001AAE5E2E|nr:hypothetical protein [Paenibacillus sp. F411]MBO2945637.1 hypothetical protein [Paenibacillus sp. F411]